MVRGKGSHRHVGVMLVLCAVAVAGCGKEAPKPGEVMDEAKQAGRTAQSFPAADEDYFRQMDGAPVLTAEEIKGRNTWIVWSGGNDRFWDVLSNSSVGTLDFLKTLSSHPKLKYSRDSRWSYLGLVNEPCFEKAKGPDPERFGLWLDKRRVDADCPPDPFENEQKYPGVAIGARGKNLKAGSYYGYASGIVGLRLFPNPAFDEAAAKKWDPVRYYEDPSYYLDKNLIKPYRVGMSCGFCHVGPNPVKPPADPENPKWENLSSTVGAQYFWVDRIFVWNPDHSSFAYQLFHTSRPGALDTSFVSTDYINNPRTMNAVYDLAARMQLAKRWGQETIAGGELDNKQFQNYFNDGPLLAFFRAPDTVWTPRVLKDGSDSVGALGALNRVYLNIGLFSEEWMLHFNALVGGKPTSPIKIADAQKNSVYWQATELQTPATALFFLNPKVTGPHKLQDAPGGEQHLSKDKAVLTRGKVVFAEYCARCHSSKGPEPAPGVDPGGQAGKDYLVAFKRYWLWTKTPEFKEKMRQIVLADDFLDGNYLSTELRIPTTLLKTNACSSLATNALRDDIWDNFSSQTYKDLPSVGKIKVHNPITGEARIYEMPAGGRGYTRPASLISVWSTAPFLLNNQIGKFDPSPSVEARLGSFNDSIEKLLWPEKRDKDKVLGDKVPGLIDRTTETSYLRVPAGYLPDTLQDLRGPLQRYLPWLFADSGIEIGPIPAGTPVNLLSNVLLVSDSTDVAGKLEHKKKLVAFLLKAKADLKALPTNPSDEDGKRVFTDLVGPLLELSRCPDFVVNRGHYFGTSEFKADPDVDDPEYFANEPPLTDADKHALIEFLKTF